MKFRICMLYKNGFQGYIIQKRCLLFFWKTLSQNKYGDPVLCPSKRCAEEQIKKIQKEHTKPNIIPIK